MGVDDEMDLGGVVYCQMGKIKYRHETGQHQGNKKKHSWIRERVAARAKKEMLVSHHLPSSRQFGRKALTSSGFLMGEQLKSSDILTYSSSKTLTGNK